MRRAVGALAVTLLVVGTAWAKVQSIEGASLGEHYYGPPRTLDGLKGHVVLWENWGAH